MDVSIQGKLEEFFTKYRQQKFKKGEILIRAKDNPPGIFYLTEGIVKKYAISRKGEEVVVNMFKAISFFPMSWAINNEPNDYFYEVVTEATVWRAPKKDVVDFTKREPDVLYDLLSRVFRGVDGMTTRMAYLMAGNAHSRLIAELLIVAKRFGTKKGNEVDLSISEKDIAAESGMTRETVSREMKILKGKGLVELRSDKKKMLTVKDVSKLENELIGGF